MSQGFTTTNPLVHLRKPADPIEKTRQPAYWLAQCGWDAADITEPNWHPKQHYRDFTTTDVSAVTCHACLDAVVRQGEAAAARVVELEREAGDEATGGTCQHRSSFQCAWCEGYYCAPLENEPACGAKLRGPGEACSRPRECDECARFKDEIYSTRMHSNRGDLTLVVHAPTSVAIVASNGHYSESAHRKAVLCLSAALGLRTALLLDVLGVPG